MSFLLAILGAHAHPSVDGHLHATEVRCDDPMAGTVAAIRRAGVLSDDGRTDDALAELEQACLPDAEVTRLARARALVHGQRPQQALQVLEGLSGADAALWRAEALVALGRDDEAGALLGDTLKGVTDAPPEAYRKASDLVPPCDAVALLDLGMQRRGDVGSLRRAAASAAWSCDQTGLERLHDDDVRDLLLAGDLLVDTDPTGARQRWTAARTLVAAQRDTPARRRMQDKLTQRLSDTP